MTVMVERGNRLSGVAVVESWESSLPERLSVLCKQQPLGDGEEEDWSDGESERVGDEERRDVGGEKEELRVRARGVIFPSGSLQPSPLPSAPGNSRPSHLPFFRVRCDPHHAACIKLPSLPPARSLNSRSHRYSVRPMLAPPPQPPLPLPAHAHPSSKR